MYTYYSLIVIMHWCTKSTLVPDQLYLGSFIKNGYDSFLYPKYLI